MKNLFYISTYLSYLFHLFRNAVTVLRQFGMEQSDFGYNILMILLQITTFKILAYFTLKHKIKSV